MKIFALLSSRTILFAAFQGLIALAFLSWSEAEKYWILTVTLTNIVSIVVLKVLLQREGIKFLSLFAFDTKRLKKDLLIFLGLAVITIPMVLLPNYFLNNLFYGSSNQYAEIMFQPIPQILIYFLLLAFPITIAFAELATYFGYAMQRLKASLKSKVLVVLIPALFLSFQHCTLPLVFQLDFILYRGLVFLPFALVIGLSLYKRPSLLPYFAIFHGFLDAMTVVMLLNQNS
jgi:hypothetical protein